MEIVDIIKTALFCADIVLLVLLLIYWLNGFSKGMIKTIINSTITIVLVLLCFWISKPITRRVIEIVNPFGLFKEDITIFEMISQSIASNMNMDMETFVSTGINDAIYDLTVSCTSLVISIIFSIIVLLIIAPIIKLIFKIFLKLIFEKKPSIISRLIGSFVGVVAYICLFAILILPIYGAAEVVSKTINEVSSVNQELSDINEDIQEGTSKSVILSITSNVGKTKKSPFGIGGKRFGKFISIKTDNGNVDFISDLGSILPFANRIIEIYNDMNTTEDLNAKIDVLKESDIDSVVNILSDSGLVRYIYPIAIKTLREYENGVIKELNLNYDVLLEIDFNNSISSSAPFLKSLYSLVKEIDLNNMDNFEQFLDNDSFINGITNCLDSAMKIPLFSECFPKVAYYFLNDSLKETEYADLVQLITPEYLRNDFVLDLKNVNDAYLIVKKTGIFDYFNGIEKDYMFDETIEMSLLEAKKALIELKLLNNNYQLIVKHISPMISTMLPLDVEAILNEDVNWQDEISVLLDIMIYGYGLSVNCFDKETEQFMIDSVNAPSSIAKIVECLKTSQLAKKYYFPALVGYLNDTFKNTDFEEYMKYITVDYLQNGFSDDIYDIFSIYNDANELDLFKQFEEGSTTLNLDDINVREKVENILTKMINLKIFNGIENVVFKKIYELSPLVEYVPYIEITNDINWDIEKQKIVIIAIDLLELGKDAQNISIDLSNLEECEVIVSKFAKLFDDMAKSEVTNQYVFALLDIIIGQTGYQFDLSTLEKEQVLDNTMEKEMAILFDVLKESKVVFGDNHIDVKDINGTVVTNLMIKASKSILASKVLGELLNETLGPDGLNINPIDETTNLPKYDFSNPQIIEKEALAIGRLIDLANSYNEISDQLTSPNDITNEQIESIVDGIKSISDVSSDSEILNDVINNICNSNNVAIDENIDWQNEANVINEVLNSYQNCPNKDEFSVDDYDMLREKIEESDVAFAILQGLGII